MRLFRFDASVGRVIERFESRGARLARIGRAVGDVRLGCFHLELGGVIGYHPASVPQMLLVVRGEGWVRGAAPEAHAIGAGQAAFWVAGELHETGTETGLMAIVVEAEDLDPAQFMPEIALPGREAS